MRRAVDDEDCQAEQCWQQKPSERYVEHLEVRLRGVVDKRMAFDGESQTDAFVTSISGNSREWTVLVANAVAQHQSEQGWMRSNVQRREFVSSSQSHVKIAEKTS